MVDVGFREGDRVAPVCVDRDIVAAHENGHDGNDCIWSQFLNVVPRKCDGVLHDIVESAVHLHDERLQTFAFLIRYRTDSNLLDRTMGASEITHDRANAVTVNMDDSDRRQHVLGILELLAVLERSCKLGWIERGFLFEFLSLPRKPLLHVVDLLLSRCRCERSLHARREG